MPKKLLTQMVEQFQERHKRLPEQIVIDPLALVALGIKKSAAPIWAGIPVVCREIRLKKPVKVRRLGVYINSEQKQPHLQAVDLD